MYHLFRSLWVRKYQGLVALWCLGWILVACEDNRLTLLHLLYAGYLGFFTRSIYQDVLFSIRLALLSIREDRLFKAKLK